MAKSSGLGDNFYLGGYDLSGDVSSVDQISSPMTPIDVTPVKYSANQRIGGLRDGDLQFTSFFENAGSVSAPSFPATTVAVTSTYSWYVVATITGGTVTNVSVNGSTVGTGDGTYVIPPLGTIAVTYTGSPAWTWTAVGTEHNALSPLPTADTVATYFRGTTVGNAAMSINGKQINYDFTRDNVGNLTAKVEVQANAYALDWGVMLTPGLRTDTTGTTGAYYDQGAGSAYGGQAYLQLVEFAGTSVDVKIEHCATSGGSYTSLVDFGSLTAVGAVRVALGNTATVDEFLKVVTSGTFTYATFAVQFTQNLVAGVAF